MLQVGTLQVGMLQVGTIPGGDAAGDDITSGDHTGGNASRDTAGGDGAGEDIENGDNAGGNASGEDVVGEVVQVREDTAGEDDMGGSLQVRKDTAGEDDKGGKSTGKEGHCWWGHSRWGQYKEAYYSWGSHKAQVGGLRQGDTHRWLRPTPCPSLSQGLSCCMQKEGSCVPDPRSSASPGLTLNSELS